MLFVLLFIGTLRTGVACERARSYLLVPDLDEVVGESLGGRARVASDLGLAVVGEDEGLLRLGNADSCPALYSGFVNTQVHLSLSLSLNGSSTRFMRSKVHAVRIHSGER